MDIKQSILEMFENNPNTFLSGESIANKLYVSRNAVWKAVKELKARGYDITAVTNKGYCMNSNSGILSGQGINKYTHTTYPNIFVHKIIDSTNTAAKNLAEKGAPEWTVIISEEQTSGKGRVNRPFYSPKGTGLYMSIILRPKFAAEKAVFITAAAAVAVARATEYVSEKKAMIKWVNDIYCNSKKVCGILTQGAVNMETGAFDYAVLGIGINVFRPDGGFPPEIENIAGYVLENKNVFPDAANRIAAEILNLFSEYYKDIEHKTFVDEYRARSFITRKHIYVIKPGITLPAEALEIDDNCGLKVRYNDGSIETLSSGEVSTKITENQVYDK